MNSGKLKFVKDGKRRKVRPEWLVEYFDAVLAVPPANEAA
jgi:hypothetical protein